MSAHGVSDFVRLLKAQEALDPTLLNRSIFSIPEPTARAMSSSGNLAAPFSMLDQPCISDGLGLLVGGLQPLRTTTRSGRRIRASEVVKSMQAGAPGLCQAIVPMSRAGGACPQS